MKRIIFDCERMKYENTGLYHYCLNLGNHLSKFATQGMEALTLYSPPGKKYLFDKNIGHIVQTELHKLRMPALQPFTIWHAGYQDSYYLPFRNKNIKVVLSVHDLNFMYDPTKSAFKK